MPTGRESRSWEAGREGGGRHGRPGVGRPTGAPCPPRVRGGWTTCRRPGIGSRRPDTSSYYLVYLIWLDAMAAATLATASSLPTIGGAGGW